jgi:hypothetical protein
MRCGVGRCARVGGGNGGFAGGVLLLGNDDGGADVFDVFEHEDGVLFGVFELLEEEERFFVVG